MLELHFEFVAIQVLLLASVCAADRTSSCPRMPTCTADDVRSPSNHRQAAIDSQGGSGNVARALRHQKCDGRGHLLRRAEALRGNLREKALARLARQVGDQFGLDE